MAEHPVRPGTTLGDLWYVMEARHEGGGQHAVLARIRWYGGEVEWGHLTYNGHSGRHHLEVSGPEAHVRASYGDRPCPLCGVKGYSRDGCDPKCEACEVRLDPTSSCPSCGVFHGEPCPECGRRGFHLDDCREIFADGYRPAVAQEPRSEAVRS